MLLPLSQSARWHRAKYHTTQTYPGLVLIGQTQIFRPHKIGTSYVFISVCCSVCFYFVCSVCPLNDEGDSKQRRMREPSSVFTTHSLKDLLPPECFSPQDATLTCSFATGQINLPASHLCH